MLPDGSDVVSPVCARQKLHWHALTFQAAGGWCVRYEKPIAPQWQEPG
jgi:hypothetical protein